MYCIRLKISGSFAPICYHINQNTCLFDLQTCLLRFRRFLQSTVNAIFVAVEICDEHFCGEAKNIGLFTKFSRIGDI